MADERMQPVLDEASETMESTILFLDDTLAHIRAGKANVRIVDSVKVDYYGSLVPLANVANISTPDAKTIAVQPWEKNMLSVIEKALLNSDIGITPLNNGEVIRLIIPSMTEERRIKLVKMSGVAVEEAKISIRNARQKANTELKKELKNGLPEDMEKDGEAEVQQLHDKFIKQIEQLFKEKEEEIMTV